MRDGGFLQKLDLSRIPNQQYINAAFKGLAWDPTDEWQLPKDYGTTGLLYRSKLVTDPLTSWKEFFELAKGKHSGKIVVVDSMGDVFTFPLKMLGYSLNSQDKDELEEARRILLELAPHVLALDSDLYGDKLASEEAAIALAWTGPIVELRADPDTADTMWVNPSEGTLFWLDTWVMLADAPHPNASYAWLDFIHRPEIQGDETNYNGYATPSDAAKEFVDPELLADPAIFPSDDVIAKLEGAEDTSGNTQRIEIWEEFKSAVGG
jgi:spermidine/putrescine transport system substrate-binding protein